MKNESHLPGNRKMKKKRGGQQGNQNARKHGFYSSTISPTEICEFWNIVNLEGIETIIAVIRIKLRSLLQHNPGNQHALREASKVLSKWYCIKYQLEHTDTIRLKSVITCILNSQCVPSSCDLQKPVKTNKNDKTNRAHFKNQTGGFFKMGTLLYGRQNQNV
jgi:hypothetical protein